MRFEDLDTDQVRRSKPNMSRLEACQLALIDLQRALRAERPNRAEQALIDAYARDPRCAAYPQFIQANWGRVVGWGRVRYTTDGEAVFWTTAIGVGIVAFLLFRATGNLSWAQGFVRFVIVVIIPIVLGIIGALSLAPHWPEKRLPMEEPLTLTDYAQLHWHAMHEVEREQIRAELLAQQISAQLGPELAAMQQQIHDANRRAATAQAAAYYASAQAQRNNR